MKTKEQIYKEIILKQSEIIKFYTKIIDANATFLWAHGINASDNDIETGKKLRDEIHLLLNQLNEFEE